MEETRRITESSNYELRLNTDSEMERLKKLFCENHAIDNRINELLKNKTQDFKKEIASLLTTFDGTKTREELMILGALINAENYQQSVYYELASIEDIYRVYKQISLLLKRYQFGYVEDLNEYLQAINEVYGISQQDVLVTLEAETS